MSKPKFRTEQEVNDYYDERGFKIENKYAKQINRIDATYEAWDRNYPIQNEKLDEKIQKNDERITKLSETISYTPNEKLTSSEEELQKLKDEIKSNLDIGIAPDRNQATRQAELELEIKQLKKDAQFETRQNQDIKNEIVSLEETQRQLILQQKNFSDALEDKQNALVSKRDEIAEKFDSDIQRNEQLRQQAIDNLPKTVPDRVVDVDGYGWTDYCDGQRIITVPIKFSIRLPDDLTIQDIPQDILQQMATEAYDYVTIDMGEIVPGGLMLWSDIKPTGAGDYHFGDGGIAYNRTEVIEPEYEGYTRTPEGYIKTG